MADETREVNIKIRLTNDSAANNSILNGLKRQVQQQVSGIKVPSVTQSIVGDLGQYQQALKQAAVITNVFGVGVSAQFNRVAAVLGLLNQNAKATTGALATAGSTAAQAATQTNNLANATTAAASGFSLLANPIGLVIAALALFSVTEIAVAVAIFKVAEAGAQFATEISRARAETGLSIENLQALKIAADLVGESFASVRVGFDQYQKKLFEAVRNPSSATAKDLSKLLGGFGAIKESLRDPNVALEKLSAGFAQLEQDGAKAALGLEAGGRGGKAFLAILDLIGPDLKDFITKLNELGVIQDKVTNREARQFTQSLILLDKVTSSLSTSFGKALFPILTELVTIFARFLALVRPLIEAVGVHLAGAAIRLAEDLGFVAFGADIFIRLLLKIPDAVGQAISALNDFGKVTIFEALAKFALGDVVGAASTLASGAVNAVKRSASGVGDIFKGVTDAAKKDFAGLTKPFTFAENKPGGNAADPETKSKQDAEAKAIRAAERELVKTRLAEELALTKDNLKREEDALHQSFDLRLVSTKFFFTQSEKLQAAAINAELTANALAVKEIQEQQKHADKESERLRFENDLVKLLGERARLEAQLAALPGKTAFELEKAAIAAQKEVHGLNAQLADLLGLEEQAFALKLAAEFEDALKKAFADGNDEILDLIGNIKSLSLEMFRFAQQRKDLERSGRVIGIGGDVLRSQQSAAEAAIQGQLARGAIDEATAKTQTLAIQRQYAAELAKTLTAQIANQEAIIKSLTTQQAGLPETSTKFKDLALEIAQGSANIEEMKARLAELANVGVELTPMQEFFKALRGQTLTAGEQFKKLGQELHDAFSDAIDALVNGDFKKLGDSFKRLLKEMIAEFIKSQVFKLFNPNAQGIGFGGLQPAAAGAGGAGNIATSILNSASSGGGVGNVGGSGSASAQSSGAAGTVQNVLGFGQRFQSVLSKIPIIGKLFGGGGAGAGSGASLPFSPTTLEEQAAGGASQAGATAAQSASTLGSLAGPIAAASVLAGNLIAGKNATGFGKFLSNFGVVGGLIARLFFGDHTLDDLNNAVRSEYGIGFKTGKDKNDILQQIKQVGDQVFLGGGGTKKHLLDTVRLDQSKDILRQYALGTGQDSKRLGIVGGELLTDQFAAANQFVRRISGGIVPGPSLGRDSVAAFLEGGEFVSRSDIVRREGLPAFNALNRGDATITGRNSSQASEQATRAMLAQMKQIRNDIVSALNENSDAMSAFKTASPNDVVMRADSETVMDHVDRSLDNGGRKADSVRGKLTQQ